MKKRFLPFLLALLLLGGCRTSEMDPGMLASDTISLMVKGKTVFTLPEKEGQLGYNQQRKEFRAGTDDMTSFFVLRCEPLPTSEGQVITGSLRWSEGETVRTRNNLSFRVEKYEDTGLVWLWCAKDKTGAVVKVLEN